MRDAASPDARRRCDAEGWQGVPGPKAAPSAAEVPAPRPPRGRIGAVIAGILLALVGVVALGAGGTLLWVNSINRHDGYLTVASGDYRASGHAIASDRVTLWGSGHLWYQASLLGDVHVTASAIDPATPVFVGIAPADRAAQYLAAVHYSTLTRLAGGRDATVDHPGSAPSTPPTHAPIWTASASGSGTQTLTWPSTDGTWMLVVMNADGSAPVDARVGVGITAPSLGWISATLLGAAALFLTAGFLLIAIPMSRRNAPRRVAP